jgi:hypothetical protein
MPKLKIKKPKQKTRAAKPKSAKKKEPKTGSDLASPLLTPKARRKSLETRRRNAARKRAKAAQDREERGLRAIATGGRVTKTGRIYEAESLQHKKEAMQTVTLKRLEDEVAAGLCIARNLTAPDGVDLKDEGKYRSLTEDLLFTFLENHKEDLNYSGLYYPERDYPHNSQDWSVTPYGKLVPWVRDFDILWHSEDSADIWFQFQGKGQNLWFLQLRKALQHRISVHTSQALYLGVRKALFDLLLRQATNYLTGLYHEQRETEPTEIHRQIIYVSYTSITDWIKHDYHLSGVQCLDLLFLESKRFHNYCYGFFKAVWPREERVLSQAVDRMKWREFKTLTTAPVDPNALTSKEIAAEFGATLMESRDEFHLDESEQVLFNEWFTAREKGFGALKLPPLYKPTIPGN